MIKTKLKKMLVTNLYNHQNMSLRFAFEYVKACRNLCRPNLGFLTQLEQWEKMHRNNISTFKNMTIWAEFSDGKVLRYNDGKISDKQ